MKKKKSIWISDLTHTAQGITSHTFPLGVSFVFSYAKEKLGNEERWEELFKDLPFGRAAKAEEVADLATFLVSPRSDYTSRTVITLDAGASNH